MTTDFHGKTAFVTGGASGIGRALATELLERGAVVAIADIHGADEAARALGCEAVCLDVTDGPAVARAVKAFTRAHDRLDLMFNNAGVAIVGETRSMTPPDWERLLAVNVGGVVHGVQAAYPIMIQQGAGHIVNTASMAGLVPMPGAVAYATSKHAIVGLSSSLRAEARGYGVRVTALCPSFVRTPIAEHVHVLGDLDRGAAMRVIDRLGWMPVDRFARMAIDAVGHDRAVVVAPGYARWLARATARSPAVRGLFAAAAAAVMTRLG